MCYLLSTLKTVLKPCAYKCDDIKKLLLTQCQTNKKILNNILESIYFTSLPDISGQKYAIISHTESKKIDIYVLLRGGENLLFHRRGTDIHQHFGKIQVTFVTYCKCYCDECIEKNVFRWNKERKLWRIHVFDKYIIPICIKKGDAAVPSLLQLSIKANIKKIKCCTPSTIRCHHLWLGDGLDPTTSSCLIGNSSRPVLFDTEITCLPGKVFQKRSHYTHTWSWDQLDYQEAPPYLFIGLKKKELLVYTRHGNIVSVRNYPLDIKIYIKNLLFIGKNDLIFIRKTFIGYRITVC